MSELRKKFYGLIGSLALICGWVPVLWFLSYGNNEFLQSWPWWAFFVLLGLLIVPLLIGWMLVLVKQDLNKLQRVKGELLEAYEHIDTFRKYQDYLEEQEDLEKGD